MNTLILAAGRYGDSIAAEIAAGREPRLDVFELQRELKADLLDFRAVDESKSFAVQAARKVNDSTALALIGAGVAHKYDAVLTTGEDIGIPWAALMLGRKAPRHTMIAHTLFPAKKRLFFQLLRVQSRMDRILVYATSEEKNAIERLAVPAHKVQRIRFHADTKFFRPELRKSVEPDLICSAGQLLRDYDTLIEAVRDRPIRARIAAGSPWIAKNLAPTKALPPNVEWRKYPRNELRDLYARSALAVVPILQNDYQTGISTILELMAMGLCVIATKTRGQTDTIDDGVNGVYVPPSDPLALRGAIEKMLASATDRERIGAAARRYVEENATLEIFVDQISRAVRESAA